MLKIDKNNGIYLTRGDNAYLTVDLGDYVSHEGDRLTLSVRKYWNDKDTMMKYDIAVGEVFEIKPEDTKVYEPGRYVYDIQLFTSLGEIITIITPQLFYIGEEVTYE